MNPILPARLDWPSAICNFILNYGALDWQVFVFLERRMPPDQFAKIRKEQFQERIARVRKLVGTGDFSAEQKQAFERFFARLESVRELRNHIAHGHLLVQSRFFDSSDSQVFISSDFYSSHLGLSREFTE